MMPLLEGAAGRGQRGDCAGRHNRVSSTRIAFATPSTHTPAPKGVRANKGWHRETHPMGSVKSNNEEYERAA
jgi:hypothetical protein